MDVNIATEGVAVSRFEAFEPEDAADDGIAARRIDGQHFSRGAPRFEDRASRSAATDFFAYSQKPERRGVAVRRVPDSELGGRDRVSRDLDVISQNDHLLIGGANTDYVAVVSGTTCKDCCHANEDNNGAKAHPIEREGVNTAAC